MRRTYGIRAIALAAGVLATTGLAMPAVACMEPSMDEVTSLSGFVAPGVPVTGAPVRDGEASADKYVILDPTAPGAPPRVVRWNGIDVAPAPRIFVSDGRAVPQHSTLASANPGTVQEALLADPAN